jgi:hypothetical protein
MTAAFAPLKTCAQPSFPRNLMDGTLLFLASFVCTGVAFTTGCGSSFFTCTGVAFTTGCGSSFFTWTSAGSAATTEASASVSSSYRSAPTSTVSSLTN